MPLNASLSLNSSAIFYPETASSKTLKASLKETERGKRLEGAGVEIFTLSLRNFTRFSLFAVALQVRAVHKFVIIQLH